MDPFYWPKMHFLKKGQKIRAWVDPPLIRAMPEKKRFFQWISSLTLLTAMTPRPHAVLKTWQKQVITLILPDILSSFEKGGHLEAGGIPSVKSFLALVFFFLECFHTLQQTALCDSYAVCGQITKQFLVFWKKSTEIYLLLNIIKTATVI